MLEKQFRKNFNDALALYIQTLEGMVIFKNAFDESGYC